MSEYDFSSAGNSCWTATYDRRLPAECGRKVKEALRLLAAVDRSPVSLPAIPTARHARADSATPAVFLAGCWPALALAAALVLWLAVSRGPIADSGSEAR